MKIGGYSFNPFPFGVPGSLRETASASSVASAEGAVMGQGASTARPAGDGGYLRIGLSSDATDGEGRGALRDRLAAVLDPIHRKSGQLDAVLDRVMAAIGEKLAGGELGQGAEALQIRFTSLRTDHGGAATIDQTVMEIGVVRGSTVAAADTTVLGLDGRGMGIDAAAIGRAWRSGSFSRSVALPSAPDDPGLEAARAALERLRSSRA